MKCLFTSERIPYNWGGDVLSFPEGAEGKKRTPNLRFLGRVELLPSLALDTFFLFRVLLEKVRRGGKGADHPEYPSSPLFPSSTRRGVRPPTRWRNALYPLPPEMKKEESFSHGEDELHPFTFHLGRGEGGRRTSLRRRERKRIGHLINYWKREKKREKLPSYSYNTRKRCLICQRKRKKGTVHPSGGASISYPLMWGGRKKKKGKSPPSLQHLKGIPKKVRRREGVFPSWKRKIMDPSGKLPILRKQKKPAYPLLLRLEGRKKRKKESSFLWEGKGGNLYPATGGTNKSTSSIIISGE